MPDYPQAYNFLGWIYADFGRYFDRKNWNRQGLELQEDFLYAADDVGMFAAQKRERYKRTIELLEQAIQVDSQFFSAYCNLGALYQEVMRIAESEACFKRAIQINPASHRPYYYLGFIYSSQGKLEEAEKAYRKGLSMLDNPYSDFAEKYHTSLGLLYRQWEKPEQAIGQYEKAIELNPGSLLAMTNLSGLLPVKEAEYLGLKARESSNSPLVSSNNSFSMIPFGYGSRFYGYKRYEEAEWMFNKVLKAKPDHEPSLRMLLISFIRTGQWEKAEKILQRDVDLFPDNSYVSCLQGWFYYLKGDPEKAESNFQHAVQIEKQPGEMYNAATYIGRLY